MPVPGGGLFDPNSWPGAGAGGLRADFREPGVRYLVIILVVVLAAAITFASLGAGSRREVICERNPDDRRCEQDSPSE